MDEAGWVDVAEVLDALEMSHDQLLEAVATNDKGRLELEAGRVRACQGHSSGTMPVTRDGLEASWRQVQPPGSLWHGTAPRAIGGIAARGIGAGRRTHVHLAPRPDSRVGKRASVDLLLEIAPEALAAAAEPIFEAPNGVILVRHVPVACIVGVTAATPAGEAALDAARQALALHRR
jgi:putative RNA 2'-phosphotransferase